MTAVRVLIAEPHANLRKTLRSLIETFTDLEVICETANGRDTLRLCSEMKPDVLLIGLGLRQLDSLVTVRLIRELPNPPYIAMIDGLFGEDHEESARKAGVDLYFTMESNMADMLESIRVAVR